MVPIDFNIFRGVETTSHIIPSLERRLTAPIQNCLLQDQEDDIDEARMDGVDGTKSCATMDSLKPRNQKQ